MANIVAFSLFKKLNKKLFGSRLLFATNVTISAVLSGAGDIIEQNYEKYEGRTHSWDKKRTRNMIISGVTIGILCHHWYHILDRYYPGRALRTVIKKVFLDQIICSPLCISTFFGTLGILENKSFSEVKDEVKEKAIILYTAEWIIWPPAQIFNFLILPSKYRVLYDNTISLGYDVFTSRVRHVD